MSESKLWDQEYREHNIASSFKGTLSRSIVFFKQFLEKNGKSLEGLKILDCGCGNGRNAIPLAEMGNVVFGLDISRGALKEAVEKTSGKELLWKNLVFIQGSMAEKLMFPDDCFDVVADLTSFDILLTRDEVDIHRKELWRVLKPGGFFLYYDMDATDPYALWLKQEGRVRDDGALVSPEPTPIPFRIYSLDEVRSIFSNFKLLASDVFRFRDTMYGREHERAILCAIFQPRNK